MMTTQEGVKAGAANLILCLLALTASPVLLLAGPPAAETQQEANEFLDRFVGHWIGVGEFDGMEISDDLEISRVLGEVFILIKDREIGGAGFEGDIYLGYDAQDEHYELYAFGSFTGFGGNLPARVMTGERSADTLITREAPARERLVYQFKFLDDDTFVWTKTWKTGKQGQPFVVQLFERQPE